MGKENRQAGIRDRLFDCGGIIICFSAKEGLGYISYMSKPNRFSVDESISYEDLSERRGGLLFIRAAAEEGLEL